MVHRPAKELVECNNSYESTERIVMSKQNRKPSEFDFVRTLNKKINIQVTIKVGDGKAHTVSKEIQSRQFEDDMTEVINQVANELTDKTITGLDEALRKKEFKRVKLVKTEKRSYQFGKFQAKHVSRRIYQGQQKQLIAPTDVLLGFEKYQRRSDHMNETLCALATETTYSNTAEVMALLTGEEISTSTVLRQAHLTGGGLFEQDKNFLATAPGKIKAELLRCESDGVHFSLQHSTRKSAEIKIGMAYTGKKLVSKGHRVLENKTVIATLNVSQEKFQEMLREKLYATYDLESVRVGVIGGDGADWVGSSFDLVGFKQTERVLDPYHVYKAIRLAFGNEEEISGIICGVATGGYDAVATQLEELAKRGNKATQKKRRACIQYLKNHKEETIPLIERDPELFDGISLGAMESNNDKFIAQRMKTRGASWSEKGAQAMIGLLMHKEELKTHTLPKPAPTPEPVERTSKRHSKREAKPEGGQIPHASFPAITSGKLSPQAQKLKRIVRSNQKIE